MSIDTQEAQTDLDIARKVLFENPPSVFDQVTLLKGFVKEYPKLAASWKPIGETPAREKLEAEIRHGDSILEQRDIGLVRIVRSAEVYITYKGQALTQRSYYHRKRNPHEVNTGKIKGKIKIGSRESPIEGAARETGEEAKIKVGENQLTFRGIITEPLREDQKFLGLSREKEIYAFGLELTDAQYAALSENMIVHEGHKRHEYAWPTT